MDFALSVYAKEGPAVVVEDRLIDRAPIRKA